MTNNRKRTVEEIANLRQRFLLELRRRGMSVRAVANQIDVSNTYLSSFISGKQTPSDVTLNRIEAWCDGISTLEMMLRDTGGDNGIGDEFDRIQKALQDGFANDPRVAESDFAEIPNNWLVTLARTGKVDYIERFEEIESARLRKLEELKALAVEKHNLLREIKNIHVSYTKKELEKEAGLTFKRKPPEM